MTASPSRNDSLFRECAAAAILYFALTVVLAYPLTVHPATMALPMGADTNLLMWLLGWDLHAIVHQPGSIFDANIYYPFHHTLAYAENVIGSALVAAPVLWTTHNPVLALNVVALLSCVLCGVGVYLLARRVGIGPLGAALGGMIFAFAPPRFFRLGQLHLTTVQWVPFCMAFVHGYFDSGRRRDLWWAGMFFALQILTSGHGAVFAAVSVALLVLWRVALGEPILPARRLRDVALPAVLVIVVGAFVFMPYRTVQHEMGLRRSLGESYLFSPNAASLIASPTHLHAWLLSHVTDAPILQDAKAFLFPGYLPLGLALVGVWAGLRGTTRRSTPQSGSLTAMARAVELLLLVAVALALLLTWTGGFRWKLGRVALSFRQPWRAWIVCALLVAIRVALASRVPLNVVTRLRALPHDVRTRARSLRSNAIAFYALLGALSFWLSLGPPFVLYRLVYDWPGFSFIRVPSRFTLVTLMAISVVAAAGFEWIIGRLSSRSRAGVVVIAGTVLVAEFAAMPLNALPYSVDIPAADRWLATRPTPFAVAEVPLSTSPDRAMQDQRHSIYMLHSTAHWQKTIHGYSGMQPALHDALYAELQSFPDENVLGSLTSLGVSYVVVHGEFYEPDEWPAIQSKLDRFGDWLTLVHVDGQDRVYALQRPPLAVLLRKRHDELAATFAGANAAPALDFYADTAVVVPSSGTILRGREAIAPWLDAVVSRRIIRSDEITDVVFGRNEAFVTGRFKTIGGLSGRTATYAEIWRFDGGQWRLASQVVNLDVDASR